MEGESLQADLRTSGRAWDFQRRPLSAGARTIGPQETDPIPEGTDAARSSAASPCYDL